MPASETSWAVTEGIRVTVRSSYVADQSLPAARRYVFAYSVRIANEGAEPAQLHSRHWIITDGAGKVEEVRGPGEAFGRFVGRKEELRRVGLALALAARRSAQVGDGSRAN